MLNDLRGRLGVAALGLLCTLPAHGGAVVGVETTDRGVVVKLSDGIVRLEVWDDGPGATVRITRVAGDRLPATHSFSVVSRPAGAWSLTGGGQPGADVTLATAALRAIVDGASGVVRFTDNSGDVILAEQPAGPAHEAEDRPWITQRFDLPAEEGIFGLGQHQQGIWDWRGHAVRLLQENMEVGVPVLMSSRGYALLWDNPSVTEVAVGKPTAGGPATVPATTRGRARVEPEGAGTNTVRWRSEAGPAVDYYFVYGGAAGPEGAMQGYRRLTGQAPLMPQWALGFWQCKERYRSEDELIGVARKYREMGVPIDGIIQDWRYWPEGKWGSHEFDRERYPDPAAMLKELHAMHFHTLISVWPKFDLGTANIAELEAAGAMYPPVIPYVYPAGKGKWYDPFSDRDREVYWGQVSRELFAMGWDGWWLDAPEPELGGKWGEYRAFPTAAGPGAEVFNAYPLMHSGGIYAGQRKETDAKRVVILTRSAYAGQQRHSAITWSGDIGSSWRTLKNQVPAGLNFVASGIPYWNTDIGGFSGVRDPAAPSYAEIFSRWFEFGSFCPMFRVHGSAPQSGTGPGKEIWRFDGKTQAIWRKYVGLRYQLMPYTYSAAWEVTSAGGSIMRPLVMEFPHDSPACHIGDQYLWGRSIMVSPVTTQGASSREVYLPGLSGTGKWYDYWTGSLVGAGERVTVDAPVDTMPIHVRAGGILVLGPQVQYARERPDAPLDVRVYAGADGAFALYEDEGDGYAYERGAHSVIPLIWDDKRRALRIGERRGEYPGMVRQRTFRIEVVGAAGSAPKPVEYDGHAVDVRL